MFTKRQHRAIQKLTVQDGGPVWWKVGTGKTRIALGWFAMIANQFSARRNIFVVVTRRRAFFDWQREMHKMRMMDDWRVSLIDKWEDVEASMMSPSPLQKMLWLVSHGMLAKLALPALPEVRAICFDEGYLYKNPRIERSKAANELSRHIHRACILSGSMMTARNPTDIFGQLYAIDQHRLLAPNLTQFNGKFMATFEMPGTNGAQVPFAPAGTLQRVGKIVRPHACVYFPKGQRIIRHIVHKCEASPQQMKYMDKLREEYYLETDEGSQLEIRSAPTIITKCQQISDGFLKVGDCLEHFPSTKYEMLFDLLEDLIDAGEKVVVWCAFVHTASMLACAFTKAFAPKIQCDMMTGQHALNVERWAKPNVRVCFATVASGASINHFEQVQYAIYYSMGMKWIDFQQSLGRTDRHASRHGTCFYYYLYTQDSLDSYVHSIVKASAHKEKQLINHSRLSKWLRKS